MFNSTLPKIGSILDHQNLFLLHSNEEEYVFNRPILQHAVLLDSHSGSTNLDLI